MRLCIEDNGKILTPHFSHARNKRFHKIFPTVSEDDKVLDYYSCAFIAEILLQGYMYITEQYFGFYSNVFGHKTKILIPIKNITQITKERTAKIFPNAVGVMTKDGVKYCFGSLLSRYTTYRFMIQVWKKGTQQCRLEDKAIDEAAESSISASWSLSEDSFETLRMKTNSEDKSSNSHQTHSISSNREKTYATSRAPASMRDSSNPRIRNYLTSSLNLPSTYAFLLICTAMLMALYMSAAFLVHGLSHTTSQFRYYDSGLNFKEIYKVNSHMHSASVKQLLELLSFYIEEIAEIKKSLDTLKVISLEEGEDRLYRKGYIHVEDN